MPIDTFNSTFYFFQTLFQMPFWSKSHNLMWPTLNYLQSLEFHFLNNLKKQF